MHPSLFKNRLPAPTQLAVFCALSLALMVADARLQITAPLRQALATVLYPVQLAPPASRSALDQRQRRLLPGKTGSGRESRPRGRGRKSPPSACKPTKPSCWHKKTSNCAACSTCASACQCGPSRRSGVRIAQSAFPRRIILDQGQMAGVGARQPRDGCLWRVGPGGAGATLYQRSALAGGAPRPGHPDRSCSRTGVRGVMYGLASNLTLTRRGAALHAQRQ